MEIRKNLHIVTLVIAIFMLFTGCVNFHSSIDMKNFKKVSGYVTDISERKVISRKGPRKEYSCTIHWFEEENEHTKFKSGMTSKPDENTTEVYVSPDNKRVYLGSAEDAKKSSILNFALFFVFSALTYIFYNKYGDKEKSAETYRNYEIGGIMFAIMTLFFIVIMSVYIVDLKKNYGYSDPINFDILMALIIGNIACIIFAVKGKKALKASCGHTC